jgi:hypothetical protein
MHDLVPRCHIEKDQEDNGASDLCRNDSRLGAKFTEPFHILSGLIPVSVLSDVEASDDLLWGAVRVRRTVAVVYRALVRGI